MRAVFNRLQQRHDRADFWNIKISFSRITEDRNSLRRENIRRSAETANLFRDAGLVVLTTLISPMAAARQEAREICSGDFMEVYVKADVAACAKRDPKGLYEKALRGEIPNFTGISAPYEAPLSPELTLDTEALSQEDCVSTLCSAIMERLGKGRLL